MELVKRGCKSKRKQLFLPVPDCTTRKNNSTLQDAAANIRAVFLRVVESLVFAPCLRRSSAITKLPPLQARIKGVNPFASATLTSSVPDDKMSLTPLASLFETHDNKELITAKQNTKMAQAKEVMTFCVQPEFPFPITRKLE